MVFLRIGHPGCKKTWTRPVKSFLCINLIFFLSRHMTFHSGGSSAAQPTDQTATQRWQKTVSQTMCIIRGISEAILKKNISGSACLVKAKAHSDGNLHEILLTREISLTSGASRAKDGKNIYLTFRTVHVHAKYVVLSSTCPTLSGWDMLARLRI